MKNLVALADADAQTRRNVLRRVGQMLFFDGLFALLLFVAAGGITWLWGWLYVALMTLIQLVGASVMPLDVIAERGSRKENAEPWDRWLTRLILAAFVALYLVCGLDQRWHWTAQYAAPWHWLAALFFVLGCLLEMWAMYANHFFSTAVRMQFERGHAVCSSGPYRFVRHPGYVGIIVYYGATPLLLGSAWALLPMLAALILLVARTALEDRTLRARLPGYSEYAARVRWRLLPGVW